MPAVQPAKPRPTHSPSLAGSPPAVSRCTPQTTGQALGPPNTTLGTPSGTFRRPTGRAAREGRCVGVWLREAPGHLRAGARAEATLPASIHPARRFPARFHPSCPALPCPGSRLSTLPFHGRGTRSLRAPKDTHTPGDAGGLGRRSAGKGSRPPAYLDGASQRGGGRAPHQLAEELRPPGAVRRLPAGGRGPDAGGRRQVEVGRVEAERGAAGGAGARLRGAEGEQQRPEQRAARRRGHPAPGSALPRPRASRTRGAATEQEQEPAGGCPHLSPCLPARSGLGRAEAQPRPPGRAGALDGAGRAGRRGPGLAGLPQVCARERGSAGMAGGAAPRLCWSSPSLLLLGECAGQCF